VQCRRGLLVHVIVDTPAATRWEASTVGDFESTRFDLVPRGGGAPAAHAVVRAMEWGSAARPGRTAGLVDLFVQAASRRQGLATHLIGELSRNLSNQGVTSLETQALQSNVPLVQLFRKLGFPLVAEGIVYRKEVRDGVP
jgi:GNAT superfamily N-acetyltransferase